MNLRLLLVQYLAHDDYQDFNFLFRLCYGIFRISAAF